MYDPYCLHLIHRLTVNLFISVAENISVMHMVNSSTLIHFREYLSLSNTFLYFAATHHRGGFYFAKGVINILMPLENMVLMHLYRCFSTSRSFKHVIQKRVCLNKYIHPVSVLHFRGTKRKKSMAAAYYDSNDKIDPVGNLRSQR